MPQQNTFQSLLGASELERDLNAPAIGADEFRREAERQEIDKTTGYKQVINAPYTTGEKFIQASRAGFAQLMSDVDNVAAIHNILTDDSSFFG